MNISIGGMLMNKLIQNLTDYHFAYLDLYRHWHADSERYTGGDALSTPHSMKAG